MPGCATVSEAMALAELGFTALKFFPAAASGGVGLAERHRRAAPASRLLPDRRRRRANAATYLALPNVVCVGGTWVAPAAAIAAGDFARIGELARAAAALRRT